MFDWNKRWTVAGQAQVSSKPNPDWLEYWKECRSTIGKFESLSERYFTAGITAIATLGAIAVVVILAHVSITANTEVALRIALAVSLPVSVGLLWVLVNLNSSLLVGAIRASIEAEHQLIPCNCRRGVGEACPCPQGTKTVGGDSCLIHLSCAIESQVNYRKQASHRTTMFLGLLGISIFLAIAIILSA